MLVCSIHTDIILTGDSLIALPCASGHLEEMAVSLGLGLSCLVLCLAAGPGWTSLMWPAFSDSGWAGREFLSRIFPDPEGLSPPMAKSPAILLQAGDRLQFEAVPDHPSQW